MMNKKFLIRAVFWIAVATLGSRLLGFLREVQLAYYFGLSPMRGAFTVAFKIPNLIRILVADAAISAAFIPVLAQYSLQKDKKEAWLIASQMLNIAFIALTTIVLLCEIFMPTLIHITTPGFVSDPQLFQHTVYLSRIIFPTVIILGMGGVIVGVLHSFNKFGAPAVAPIFWNTVNLLAVFFLHQQWGIYAAAWGLLAATFVQLFVQASPFMYMEWKYSFQLLRSHPAIRHIGALMIPVTLSMGIINFNALIDNFFASLLGPSEVAAIDSAFRLFQLPQGMFAIAIGTVLFPIFSNLVVKNDLLRFSSALETGLRQIFFATLPFTGWFLVLSLPIARFCFERGEFTPHDSQMVSWALFFYAIGMAFTSANTLLNRGFYSLKKMWLPLYVGLINIGLKIIFNWLLTKPLGLGGICLSTSFVSIFNFFALCYLIKREIPQCQFKPLAFSFFRTALITIILSFVSYKVWKLTYDAWGDSFLSQGMSLISGFISGALVYAMLAWVFKFKEAKEGLILFQKEKLQPEVPLD